MAFTYIDSNDLNYWSGLPSSKSDLPLIISRLIRRSSPGLQSALIPIGISTFSGGWDGIVNNRIATEFVPMGLSLWEMGTEKQAAVKAEKDYQKRKENVEPGIAAEAIFIFVTTRPWQNKQKWIDAKKADGIFADIRVIDADMLVEWLNISPVTIENIAHLIGRKVDTYVQPLSRYYEEWASGPKMQKMPPALVCAGREMQLDELALQLSGPPNIVAIKAGTRDEALAFIAAAMQLRDVTKYDNTVIVDSKENLVEMMATTLSAIVANLPDTKPLFHLNPVSQHILLPLGAADKFEGGKTIPLPKLGREETVKALQELGLDEDHARSISYKTGRSLSVIRRILGFDNLKPAWANAADDLLPALLVGKWMDDREGDRQIIEYLSGQSYDDYTNRIRQWAIHHDAPITNVGNMWRLISSLDCWEYLGRYVSARQIKQFEESFLIACGDIKPALSLKPEERKYAGFLGKTADFSRSIREGLAQSVILIANFGEANLVSVTPSHQIWADHLVRQLITKPDQNLWKSLDEIMPLLANASPSAMLGSLEHFIDRQPTVLESVFENAPSFIYNNYYHTGLLWALEGMAWLPNYLLRSTLLFIKLAKLDPGVKIMNRPINSLHQVFQPMMPQTYASNGDRMQVLDTVIERFPDDAWSLFLGLLPGNSQVAHTNEKLRWQEFVEESPEVYSDEKYHSYVSFISMRIFEMAGRDVERLVILLKRFADLCGAERSKLLHLVQENALNFEDPNYKIWESIREILYNYHNDYYPFSQLPAYAVAQFEKLYIVYTPKDATESNIWVFNDHWPKFPERIKQLGDDWEGRGNYMEKRRKESLTTLLDHNGFPDFLLLVKKVAEPGIFGKTASMIKLSSAAQGQFAALVGSSNNHESLAGSQFIYWYQIRNGLSKTQKLFEWLEKEQYPFGTQLAFLLALRSTFEIWQYVAELGDEIENSYWVKCETDLSDGDVDHLNYQLNKLFDANRFISAVYLVAHIKESFETPVILKAIERLATEKAEETTRLDHNHVTYLFKECYERNDYDVQQMMRLEWLFAEWLTDRYSPVEPKELYRELRENPELFAEFLKYSFPMDDQPLDAIDFEGLDETHFKQRAKTAHSLIDNLDKVPGQFTDEAGQQSLDGEVLNKWVEDLRKLAHDRNRQKRAESFIGKIMANFPENPVCWPPSAIAAIIERIDSDKLRSSFSRTVTNKRSFTSRSPYAGGQIERNNARYFRNFEDCHRLHHPITAQIFAEIALRYDLKAKQEDDEARVNDLDY